MAGEVREEDVIRWRQVRRDEVPVIACAESAVDEQDTWFAGWIDGRMVEERRCRHAFQAVQCQPELRSQIQFAVQRKPAMSRSSIVSNLATVLHTLQADTVCLAVLALFGEVWS